MNRRQLLQWSASLATGTLALALVAGSALAQSKPIKIGVTAGPHAEIMEEVKKVAEKDGLKLQIVEFNDYIQPVTWIPTATSTSRTSTTRSPRAATSS